MRFVTVRDLRGRSAEIWRRLAAERELIITSNGKPVAILSSVSEGDVEGSLAAIRRARAMRAVALLQGQSVARGAHRMSPREIVAEIAAVRRKRAR